MPSDIAASLPLLVLSGGPYETGLQYGHLMRREILAAVAAEAWAIGPLLAAVGMSARQVSDRVQRLGGLLPADVHDELRGISDATGVARETLLAHTLTLDILSGAPIGCSQFAAFGRATRGGSMIHGHNLDVPYRSLAQFVRPMCVVYRRTGRIPYASITFWPAALGVCSGINAEGLSLGVNVPVAPMDERDFAPLTFQNREVLSRSSTMAAAIDVLTGTQRGGNWNLMLAHRSGQARVWEQAGVYSGHCLSDPDRDFVVSTNHFVAAHEAATGHDGIVLAMLQEMQEDSICRHRRLDGLVAEHHGHIDVERAVDFLRDCHDGGLSTSPNMRTICRVDNVLSMVYAPGELALDLAAGREPAALQPRRRLRLREHFIDRIELAERPPDVAFPMRGEPDGEGRRRRTFDVGEDLYLREHRVNGVPVLPGAAAIEWLAEVAAADRDGDVAEILDVSLDRFIRVRHEQPTHAYVRCQGAGGVYALTAHADLMHPRGAVLRAGVPHYHARVLLGAREPRRIDEGFGDEPGLDGEIPFSRSYVDDAYFHVGSLFRIVEWIRFLNPREAIAALRVPDPVGYYASVPRARFWVDPFVLDACFQAAGTLGILHNARAPVPRGLRRLRLGVDPRPGERLLCRALLIREAQDVLYYDFTVWNQSGEVCMSADDYASNNVDAYTPSQTAHLINGLDPAGRLRRMRSVAHV